MADKALELLVRRSKEVRPFTGCGGCGADADRLSLRGVAMPLVADILRSMNCDAHISAVLGRTYSVSTECEGKLNLQFYHATSA